jgi:hypothetical protein
MSRISSSPITNRRHQGFVEHSGADTTLVPREMTFDASLNGLRHPWRRLSVKQSWIKRFLERHEQETVRFSNDVQAFLRNTQIHQMRPPASRHLELSSVTDSHSAAVFAGGVVRSGLQRNDGGRQN